MLITLLILQLSYLGIKENYYSKNSALVASQDVTALSFSGDSLYWSMARIARANYKQGDHLKAYNIVEGIELDNIKKEALYWDIQSLKALLLSNLNRFNESDSLFIYLDSVPVEYRAIKYRVYLNHSMLCRKALRYICYSENLKKALEYANDQRSKDKVIRNLAKMYIIVERDVLKAHSIIAKHTPLELIGDEETKIGFLQIQGRLQMLEKDFERSRESYSEASTLAISNGFIMMLDGIQEEYFRLDFSEREQKRKDFFMYAMIALFAIVVISTKYLNYKYDEN